MSGRTGYVRANSSRAGARRKGKPCAAAGLFSFDRRLRVERLEGRWMLAAGDLDPTFDTDGIVTSDLLHLNPDEIGSSVAIQSDGKIVVAGSANN